MNLRSLESCSVRTKERCRLIERYLENLESSSVLTKRALLIEHGWSLGSLESSSVPTQRAMQAELSRDLDSLEGSSVLSKRALLVEQRRCLEALRAARYTHIERCR